MTTEQISSADETYSIQWKAPEQVEFEWRLFFQFHLIFFSNSHSKPHSHTVSMFTDTFQGLLSMSSLIKWKKLNSSSNSWLINWSTEIICKIIVFKGQFHWFQLHKCDYLLLLLVFYDRNLNILGGLDCWLDKTSVTNVNDNWWFGKLWQIFFTIFWIIKKIISRWINNENNCCLQCTWTCLFGFWTDPHIKTSKFRMTWAFSIICRLMDNESIVAALYRKYFCSQQYDE